MPEQLTAERVAFEAIQALHILVELQQGSGLYLQRELRELHSEVERRYARVVEVGLAEEPEKQEPDRDALLRFIRCAISERVRPLEKRVCWMVHSLRRRSVLGDEYEPPKDPT